MLAVSTGGMRSGMRVLYLLVHLIFPMSEAALREGLIKLIAAFLPNSHPRDARSKNRWEPLL